MKTKTMNVKKELLTITAKDCGVRPQHIEAIGKTLLLNI